MTNLSSLVFSADNSPFKISPSVFRSILILNFSKIAISGVDLAKYFTVRDCSSSDEVEEMATVEVFIN